MHIFFIFLIQLHDKIAQTDLNMVLVTVSAFALFRKARQPCKSPGCKKALDIVRQADILVWDLCERGL